MKNAVAKTSCINWNFYYNQCHAGDLNPFRDAISFDNIGTASLAIFQVYLKNFISKLLALC